MARTTLPWSGLISPTIILMIVDFPAPFGPSSATISPVPTESETSSTAVTGPNRFVTRLAVIAGFIPSNQSRDAPGGARTPSLLIRSQMLYPIELRAPLADALHKSSRRVWNYAMRTECALVNPARIGGQPTPDASTQPTFEACTKCAQVPQCALSSNCAIAAKPQRDSCVTTASSGSFYCPALRASRSCVRDARRPLLS